MIGYNDCEAKVPGKTTTNFPQELSAMSADPESPTVVHKAANSIEANAVATALEAEGIKAQVTGNFTSNFQVEIPSPVEVVVRLEDAAKAHAILERLEREANASPPDEND